jgi:hypothetical protein
MVFAEAREKEVNLKKAFGKTSKPASGFGEFCPKHFFEDLSFL